MLFDSKDFQLVKNDSFPIEQILLKLPPDLSKEIFELISVEDKLIFQNVKVANLTDRAELVERLELIKGSEAIQK